MKGRWRFDVLRVQYLYSFAHLTAIGHILSGRTREWVATGASGPTTPLAVTISRNVKATCSSPRWSCGPAWCAAP